MYNLQNWFKKHNISQQAIDELIDIFQGVDDLEIGTTIVETESDIQKLSQLEASKKGDRLWRNNVGVWFDERGIPVRYGLCNISKRMNERLKSSDLIGITQVLITPEMVGSKLGVFTAEECKKHDWIYTDTDHERAQLNFLTLVTSLNGIARFRNR